MKRMRLFTVILVAVGVLFVNAFGQSDETRKCPKTVKVQVEKITGSEFKEYKNFSANFSPEEVTVRSPVSGKVTDIRISDGDLVSRDWVIAVINNALADEIKNLQTEIATWEKTLRNRRNWKERSERAEKQAEDQIAELRARLEKTESEAVDYTIKSPIAGTVKSLNVEKDIEISQNTVITTIVNDKKLIATLSIDEEDEAMFSTGQKVLFKINGIEDGLYAEIVEIKDREVFFVIDNSEKKIEDRFTLEFQLLKKEYRDVVVFDEGSLLSDENGRFVYIVSGKVAQKVYVKLGSVVEGRVLVLDGVSIGDELIVSEVISKKRGEISKDLRCLSNNKKIKILDIDLKTIKRKAPKKGIKKEKRVSDKEEARVRKEERIKAEEEARKKEVAEKEKKKVEIKISREDAAKRRWELKKIITDLKIKKIEKEKEKLEAEFQSRTDDVNMINREIEELEKEILQNQMELANIEKKIEILDTQMQEKLEIKIKRKVPIVSDKNIGLGIGIGYTTMSDEDFKEVYAAGGVSGLFHFSYNINKKFEIFIDITYMKQTGEIEIIQLPSDVTLMPIYIGGKYLFETSGKVKPYLGLSAAIFNVKEKNDLVENAPYNTGFGFAILAGTYFQIGPKLDLFIDFKFNIGKIKIKDFEDSSDQGGFRLHLGLVYKIYLY